MSVLSLVERTTIPGERTLLLTVILDTAPRQVNERHGESGGAAPKRF